jgi:hypothetical protein
MNIPVEVFHQCHSAQLGPTILRRGQSRLYLQDGGLVMGKFKFTKSDFDAMRPKRTPEEIAERKKFATLCGHVSRRLYNNERLTGMCWS